MDSGATMAAQAPNSQREQDIALMLAAQCHLGTNNCTNAMERYVFRRNSENGIFIIDLNKTYEKMRMAARAIVAIENPQDVIALSARPYGQRAVLKFAQHLNCKYEAGRHTPGTFTNQIQKTFEEPRLILVTDPRTDHQPVKEASYMNIPCVAFADTDSPLNHVDIAIPCNNKSKYAIGVMYFLLARMVLEMRGVVTPQKPFDGVVDLFFYRDPEEAEAAVEPEAAAEFGAPVPGAADAGFGTFGEALPGEKPEASWGGAPAEAGYGAAAGGFEAADWAGAPAAAPAASAAEGAAAPTVGEADWE